MYMMVNNNISSYSLGSAYLQGLHTENLRQSLVQTHEVLYITYIDKYPSYMGLSSTQNNPVPGQVFHYFAST